MLKSTNKTSFRKKKGFRVDLRGTWIFVLFLEHAGGSDIRIKGVGALKLNEQTTFIHSDDKLFLVYNLVPTTFRNALKKYGFSRILSGNVIMGC